MRGERKLYTQGIKLGHLHVSQRLLSMIVDGLPSFAPLIHSGRFRFLMTCKHFCEDEDNNNSILYLYTILVK